MTSRRTMLVVLLVLAFATPLFSAETLVKPETATPIEICPSCKEVRVLLVPDSKSKIKLNEGPNVEGAYFNGAAPRDASKFTAQWIGEKFPREIKVALNPDETKQAGMYDLYLNLQPDSEPGAGRLKVQMVRPAASLEAIPKLIINRTYGFIGADSYPDLRLTETSKKSGITISGIRPVSNSVIGTRPIGGTLGFPQVQPEIKPGDQIKLNYTLDGCFELGTATGTMKIDAPQLASPVSFDFEVRSRFHSIWIGITIFLALVASWIVKVKLQQKIELDLAKLDAQKLDEVIKEEERRHPDPVFAKTYQGERQNLTAAMDGNSANEINTSKLALDSKWRDELKEHEKKHKDEEVALEKLHDQITSPNWLVPPDIVKAIVEARKGVADVKEMLKSCTLHAAGEKRKEIIAALGSAIKNYAVTWQDREQANIEVIQGGPPGIPSSPAISAWLAQSATNLRAFLHKVDTSAKLETIEQFLPALGDLQNERAAVKEYFDQLSLYIQMDCDSAARKIPDSIQKEWKADIFDKAPTAVREFTEFLITTVDNPDVRGLLAELDKVHKAWTNALKGQFDPQNIPAELDHLLDTRDYIRATAMAVQQMTTGISGVGSPQPAILLHPFYPVTTGAGPPIYANYTLYQQVSTRAPAVRTSVTLKKKLRFDKGIQSAIIAGLLCLAGYGIHLNTFVGTFTDISTIFSWAFALDLTVDQVIKLKK